MRIWSKLAAAFIVLGVTCVSFKAIAQDVKATWLSGSNQSNQNSVYGELGVPSSTNTPGARHGAGSWTASNGYLYLFGGSRLGINSGSTSNYKNDLWQWDGLNWTWIGGSNERNLRGIYGTMGTGTSMNQPGGRSEFATWIDSNGDLYLFGGFGYDSRGFRGYLNDLWRWDGENWTWIGGSNLTNQNGVAGVKGVASGANIPGGREDPVFWKGSDGKLFLFGGGGFDSQDGAGWLNDLWQWDGVNWTWLSGSDINDHNGDYGVLNVASPSNVPGGRLGASSWIDTNGNAYVFGGYGRTPTSGTRRLNDLWKWDGSNWTWINGSKTSITGVYGTKGVASTSNLPEARSTAAISYDQSTGNVYLFGGVDQYRERLNDLWKWDGTHWTWLNGSATVKSSGVYGVKELASTTNIPGARRAPTALTGVDGSFYLFGGSGYDGSGSGDNLNDLWRISVSKTSQTISFDELVQKVYGDISFNLEATSSSGLDLIYTSSSKEVATISGNTVMVLSAGSTTITASHPGNATFAPAKSVAQTLVVGKATLTATGEDTTREKGLSNPDFAITYSGFVNGEDVSVLDSSPTASSAATTFSNRGNYDINLSGGDDDNYDFILEKGVLTVVGPVFELPNSINFEQTALGSEVTIPVIIENTGDGPLRIQRISLPDGFAVDMENLVVNQATSTTIMISFSPIEARSYSGEIEIHSNDGVNRISLVGEGAIITSVEEDVVKSDVVLMPNPANNFVSIVIDGALAAKTTRLKIVDLAGKLKWQSSSMAEKLVKVNLNSFKSGVYMVVVITAEEMVVKRLLINR